MNESRKTCTTVFSLSTIPYQELQQQLGWRYAANSRVGKRPARQYIGPDDETITLSGVLLPELTGGSLSLAMLREMADQGTSWPLIEGTGRIYGMFVIESLSTTRSLFFADGAARRIEFSLTLKRGNDDDDQLGLVTETIKKAIHERY